MAVPGKTLAEMQTHGSPRRLAIDGAVVGQRFHQNQSSSTQRVGDRRVGFAPRTVIGDADLNLVLPGVVSELKSHLPKHLLDRHGPHSLPAVPKSISAPGHDRWYPEIRPALVLTGRFTDTHGNNSVAVQSSDHSKLTNKGAQHNSRVPIL